MPMAENTFAAYTGSLISLIALSILSVRGVDTPPTLVLNYTTTGINGESSFEAEMLERTSGCQVWGYDFSVNSVRPDPLHSTIES